MKLIRLFLLVGCAILAHPLNSALAQIRPSRTVAIEPLDYSAEAGPAASAWWMGEGFRGWGSLGDEQAWQYRLHGGVEPYRWESDDSVTQVTTSLQLHHELTANPFSSIGFNPRTARWEEELLVHVRLAVGTLQGGWLHRCKHEIDNTEPANESDPMPFIPTTRVIILSGPKAAYFSPTITTPIGNLRLHAGGEWYLVAADYRTPSLQNRGSWSELQSAAWLRCQLEYPVSQRWLLGGSWYASVPFWRSRMGAPPSTLPPHDGRIELYLSATSSSAFWSIVAAVETQFDDVVFLTAQPTTVWQVGLRIGSR